MANIYESENFNIVSVFEKTVREEYPDGYVWENPSFVIKVQRLPLDQYPEITDVFIPPNELSTSITKEQFLELAPSIIAENLNAYDSSYSGEGVVEVSVDEFIQKFSD